MPNTPHTHRFPPNQNADDSLAASFPRSSTSPSRLINFGLSATPLSSSSPTPSNFPLLYVRHAQAAGARD
uniref:Uncharacterized protein n=1 Tax=Triticum urartu TaxID=4572 RepID=A0A8R7QAS3_TRIUA